MESTAKLRKVPELRKKLREIVLVFPRGPPRLDSVFDTVYKVSAKRLIKIACAAVFVFLSVAVFFVFDFIKFIDSGFGGSRELYARKVLCFALGVEDKGRRGIMYKKKKI